ncbi:TetR/AcrR family transcriptional regulator [Sphingobium ummariense]|uniref:TetR family transcriptional regulator n=1 Tax=Sphingobium ummariense RL-3 TaxID=1346791 RepID=T0J1H6_9SPHN|nr:TetR/AcrR family transcriptional regulator [Sphingobium ummariense]EQB30637.1 TetR family transcriptional regulator [Sphingobium ummariense RL-3]
MKEGNEVTTPRKKTQTDTPRLPRAERERLIVEGAVQFFAEVGFGGDTRELAKRLNITHPLLFRYFASKNALIERVYQEVFIGRWNPYWEIVISNRNVPLRERLVNVYQALAQTVLNYDWVRLFMFAGLKGSDINGRWYSFMQEHLVRPVCAEFRHDLGLPTIEEMPLTQNESELVLGVNSRIFYLGVRKFIYGVDTPENVDAWVEMEIILFLDGVVNIYPGLVAPPGSVAKIGGSQR